MRWQVNVNKLRKFQPHTGMISTGREASQKELTFAGFILNDLLAG